jgi:hypothetical protein
LESETAAVCRGNGEDVACCGLPGERLNWQEDADRKTLLPMVFIFFSSGPTLLRTTVVCFLFKHTNDYFFIFLRQHQQLLVDEVTSSIPSLSFRFHTFTYVCSQQRNKSICTCAINSFHRLDETLDTELSPLDGPKKCLKPLVHLQPSGLPRGCRTHRIITLCETGELTHKNGQGILAPRSICSLF